jgi:uncharacterized repeat protein (TIGR01451 family)
LALLRFPSGVTVDGEGNVFIADTLNHRVRKVTPNGIITTVAGNGTPGATGNGGPAVNAQLFHPAAVAVDGVGNLFIAESCFGPIRKVSPAGIITAFGDNDAGGRCDYYDHGYYGAPGIAVDAAGNLFVAEFAYHRIRKITPAGVISTVAGSETPGFSGDGGPATSARLSYPSAVAVDAAGNLFIADTYNYRIRKVTPAGIISTIAGKGTAGFSGDGGPAISAEIRYVTALAVDIAGNLFLADPGNNRIRKVTPFGIIRTVVGSGLIGFSGDGGPVISAVLNYPNGVAVDAAGNLFLVDSYNGRVRRVESTLAPKLTSIRQELGAQGSTVTVTLEGTSLLQPLTVDAGSGIAVSAVTVTTDLLATATLTIAADAALGARSLTVTTPLGTTAPVTFTVVPPFPDLSVTSAHVGNLAAGSNAVFTVRVVNVGAAATTSALTMTDELPPGLTFVSSDGNGWTCSASGQTVNCANSGTLAAGASTTLALTVDVGTGAASSLVHTPKVLVADDLIAANNTASEAATVATLTPTLQFLNSSLTPGQQNGLNLTVPIAFPVDVTGVLRISFSPDTTIPADDPAIQFATGGREITFTIPANTVEARFGVNSQATLLGFQPGTVAGALTFSGTVQAGAAESAFSTTQSVPRQAPTIQTVWTDTADGFAAVITLWSTSREVTTLALRFDTTAPVQLSCGGVTGCAVSGSTLTFDVRHLFDAWFASGDALGSLSRMRLPFSITGTAHGTVWVTFRNSLGTSKMAPFSLP